jgi:hypothetical protein
MNPKVKTAILLGLCITIFYFLHGLFNEDHLSAINILGIFISSIIAAASGAAIMVWLSSWYSRRTYKFLKIELAQNERLIFDSLAIHSKRPFSSEGKLFLTDKRLVFRPGKFNIRKKEISLNLFDLSDFNKYKTFGFFNGRFANSGIVVQTQRPSKEKFIVESADSWIEHIKSRN